MATNNTPWTGRENSPPILTPQPEPKSTIYERVAKDVMQEADIETQSNAGNTSQRQHDEPEAIYSRFTRRRKNLILATLCYCGFLTPISSTAVLVAIPEVAQTLHSTGVIINVSNALFFVAMALSPLFWGPIAQHIGRRPVFLVSSVLLTVFSGATALSPEVVSYFVFRMLTALQGTATLVVGSVVVGDIYAPTERGRALGVFMSGILVGPTVAPLLGGIITTFTTWRVIFWVICGLSGLSAAMIVFFLPETAPEKPSTFANLSPSQRIIKLGQLSNPWTVLQPLLAYRNLWIAALAVSSLIWNQYSLLTPIRYVLNPRFNLTSPLQSALFFLPPGAGYLLGTFAGGRWSDWVVARYISKRGRRVPEDRLKGVVLLMAIVIPSCMIVYGWAIEKQVGGIPLVVVVMFLQGFTQLLVLPSLNTYLIDVLHDKGQSSVAVAGNYLARFMFAAAGTAVCLPAIRAIGVGWFSTMSALFIAINAVLVWLLTRYGEKWRISTGSKALA